MNKNNIYLLQNNTKFLMHICICTNNILYLLENNTKQKTLGFQNTGLILS